MKQFRNLLFFFATFAFVAGCAPTMQPPLNPLDAGSSKSVSGSYDPKVNNFQVILDSSLSMDEGRNYFLSGRELASRINQGVPTDLKYTGGLRSFGHSSYQSKAPTELLYGMTAYTRSGFHDGLNKIKYTGGDSPLDAALLAAASDLATAPGKSALIVISDGLHMDAAPEAAKKAKASLGGNLCIYTISVGSANNGAGQDLLQKVAEAGQCGFAIADKDLASSAAMDAFIEKVFLEKAAPKAASKPAPVVMAPVDSDGDGVFDDKDQCPNTPKGEFVDESGCTLKLTLHVNFDVDSAVIKPEFKSDLDSAAAYIKKYDKVPYVLIAGHTDQTGTVEYNQKLSENRANAVRQSLIDNYGIDPQRLFAKGFGKLQPIADNTTDAGRYQNRRVEVVCCALKPL